MKTAFVCLNWHRKNLTRKMNRIKLKLKKKKICENEKKHEELDSVKEDGEDSIG